MRKFVCDPDLCGEPAIAGAADVVGGIQNNNKYATIHLCASCLEKWLEDNGPGDIRYYRHERGWRISETQRTILGMVRARPQTVRSVTRALRCHEASAQRCLQRLYEAGLIQRHSDPTSPGKRYEYFDSTP